MLWTISDMLYGNEEKGRKPDKTFVAEIEKYPLLKECLIKIEGCIKQRGVHASGVIMFDDNPYDKTAFMRTPDGEIITQYDLHDDEKVGLTKLDFLVTKCVAKIDKTIEFLQQDGLIDPNLSLREAYNKYLHPDVLPLNDKATWETIQESKSLDLFQFSTSVGRQGVKTVKPDNITDLSSTNALIRLMGDSGERPMDKYVKFKNDLSLWYQEMENYNLTKEEQRFFERIIKETYGVGISQEQFMRSLLDKDLVGFDLSEATKARKIVSKKRVDQIPELKEKIEQRAKNERIGRYLWDAIVKPQLGYSFCDIHSTEYTYISYQTAYLATKWNSVYWNTACLLINSGAVEQVVEKQKEKTTDYGKIAKAIGDCQSQGIEISTIDINESEDIFKPDAKNNKILFGLKGIPHINNNTIAEIKSHRPYISLKDFLERTNGIDIRATINLIKAGAFDAVENQSRSDLMKLLKAGAFKIITKETRKDTINLIKTDAFDNIKKKSRKYILFEYFKYITPKKSNVTLSTMKQLLKYNLLDEGCQEYIQMYKLHEWLKLNKIKGQDFYLVNKTIADELNQISFNLAERKDEQYVVYEKQWKKEYNKYMKHFKEYLRNNKGSLINQIQKGEVKELFKKYCPYNQSYWEIETLGFYHGEHELANVDTSRYGISDFNKMSYTTEVDKYYEKQGKKIPIYKIYTIAGTVIDKNKKHSSILLITTTGTVEVKMPKFMFVQYDKVLECENGKKENSWFDRGTKLLVKGYRREDSFVVKTYNRTEGYPIYLIQHLTVNGKLELRHERE